MTAAALSRSRCQFCRAEVVWALTKEGRKLLLDPELTGAGNIVVIGQAFASDAPLVHVFTHAELSRARAHGHLDLYLSHQATCPQASQWRHREKRTEEPEFWRRS